MYALETASQVQASALAMTEPQRQGADFRR